jgi:hypothetical protein
MTEQPRTVGTGQLGHDNQDRVAGTGQLGQDGQDRTVGTVQPGMTIERDGKSMAAWTGKLEKDYYEKSHDRTTRTGYRDRMAGIGQIGEDSCSWERSAGTGQFYRTVWILQPKQE